MTSFRSLKSNSQKEDRDSSSSNWYRLGLRSGKRGKNRTPIDSFAPLSSASSVLSEPVSQYRSGLRHLPSDNHIRNQYSLTALATPAPSILSTSTYNTQKPYSASVRKPPTNMAGMLDMDRARSRRDRTFIGNQCAVCDEPLEHTLRGERVLQFSCSHVSHEACFYEYIKEFESQYCPECNAPLGLDSSRGGNVLDLGIYFNS